MPLDLVMGEPSSEFLDNSNSAFMSPASDQFEPTGSSGFVSFMNDFFTPERINAIAGKRYVLGDLVLRKSRSEKSYMPWHRDTYLDRNRELVGRVPPLLKVIYYPHLDVKTNHELSVLTGSTKRIAKNYIIDKLQRFFFKEKKIYQSNSKIILFDSSIIHSAIPSPMESKGSFRLIFNFCDESQVGTFLKGKKLNEIFQKLEDIHRL